MEENSKQNHTDFFKLAPSNAKTDDRYEPSHSREDSQWKHELEKEEEPQ